MPTYPNKTVTTLAAAALVLGLASAAPEPEPAQSQSEAPPGLVPIKGGRIKIGTKVKDIEPLILANEAMGPFLAGETPKHTVPVADFYLMVTEVTNEQFAAFVAATDGRPPYTWGDAAIEAARKEFFEEQNRKRQEAKAAGETYRSTEKFDAERWWEENWQDADWEVPDEIASEPVTHVAYEEAAAYASWAGLRLMTEAEYKCAGRGTTDDTYTWGKDWDPSKVAGLDAGRDRPWPVGSFPDGARSGVHDLLGNVWEWTSSPYVAFPGYKALKLKSGRGKNAQPINTLAPFDANKRIIAGGSVHLDPLGLRIDTRMPASRFQRTNALGFRCAASKKSGRDVADLAANEMILGTAKPEDAEYLIELPTLLHRWSYEGGGTSEQGDAASASAAPMEDRPAGYAVIREYDAMLFVPTKEINAVNTSGLDDETEKGPAHIGVFYTSVPIVEPALEPGSYMVAYRTGAELRELAEDEEEPAWRTFEGYDPKQTSLLFFDGEGAPVAAWPVARDMEPLYTNLKEGRADVLPWQPPKKVDKDAPPPTPLDTVKFEVFTQGRQRKKGFKFNLPFKVEPGTVDETWHP